MGADKSHKAFRLSSRKSCGNISGTHRLVGTGDCPSGPGPCSFHTRFVTSSFTSPARPMSKLTSVLRHGGENLTYVISVVIQDLLIKRAHNGWRRLASPATNLNCVRKG